MRPNRTSADPERLIAAPLSAIFGEPLRLTPPEMAELLDRLDVWSNDRPEPPHIRQ